jgi:hypothetical protein
MSNISYRQGKHPNSISNLIREGRPLLYEQQKKARSITLTDDSWNKLEILAKAYNCASKSEFIEKICRGEIQLS